MQVLRIQRLQMVSCHCRSRQIKSQRAASQTHNAREIGQRHFHMVQRSHQCGAAFACYAGQAFKRMLRTGRVQRGQRLIDQQQAGFGHQRPGQAHTLTLAARQAVHAVKQLVAHVKTGQGPFGPGNVHRVEQAAQAGQQTFVR